MAFAATVTSIYASFTGNGIYKWDGTWTQLTPGNPVSMVTSGTNLYASFAGNGIYKWDGTWTQLTPGNPVSMVASDTSLYASFAGNGIYKWDGTWTQLTPGDPVSMVTSGTSLYASFAGNGIYKWDGAWTQLTPGDPVSMVTSGTSLYASFAGNGIYKWDGTWTQLTPGNPVSMVTSGTNLYASFAGNGIYKWDGTWTQLTPGDPVSMVTSGTSLYASFAGNGIYKWDGTWTQLTPGDPVSMVTSGTSLYASFSGNGIYKWDGTWTQLTPGNPASMVIGSSEFNFSALTYLHYVLPDQYTYLNNGGTADDEAATLFSGYTATVIDDGTGTNTTTSAYALGQFVNKATVNAATPDPDHVLGTNDARGLYSAFLRSNQDGFSNRTKFYDNGTKAAVYNADLRWDQYIQGYLLDLNYTGKSFFPASVGLAKMYNLKYSYDIYMFRKIDVKRPDAAGSLATFEVSATTTNYVDDTKFTATNSGLTTTKFTVGTISFDIYSNVKAIPLNQFLTDYVTDRPGSYTYKIVALDGTYKEGWTYADMQQAYYLPDLDFIVQVTGGSQVAGTKINYPVRIELIGAAYEYVYSAKSPPAYAKAYDGP
jgi:hypothetical protein